MVTIYKSQKVKIPNISFIKKLFTTTVGLGIDFGPFFLPGITLLAYLTFSLSYNLFLLIYFSALFVSIFWLYILTVNFYNIKVTNYTLHNKKITMPVKIIYISDIHIGYKWEETNKIRLNRIINKINKLDKDLILIGGDILNHNYTPKLLEQFKNLNGTKIAVLGNHDNAHVITGYHTKETPINLINKLKECGITVLINSGLSISKVLFIGGIKDLYTLDFDVDNALLDAKTNQYKVLLSHNPDIISYNSELQDVDLVISGHNHGGQINIFGIHLPIPSLRQWLTHGVYNLDKHTKLILSSGIGVSGSRVRLGTKYEIVQIDLLPQNTTL